MTHEKYLIVGAINFLKKQLQITDILLSLILLYEHALLLNTFLHGKESGYMER